MIVSVLYSNFHEFTRCIVREGEKVWKCTPKKIDFVEKWWTKMMDGILQLLCSVYDESNDQCDSIVDKTPVRKRTEKPFKSILMPTINIAMSLGEDELI